MSVKNLASRLADQELKSLLRRKAREISAKGNLPWADEEVEILRSEVSLLKARLEILSMEFPFCPSCGRIKEPGGDWRLPTQGLAPDHDPGPCTRCGNG